MTTDDKKEAKKPITSDFVTPMEKLRRKFLEREKEKKRLEAVAKETGAKNASNS